MVCGASEKTQHGLPSWWGPDHRTVRPPHCLKQYRCCCLAGTAHVALAQPAGPSVPDPWAPPNTDNALHFPMRLCYCQATLPSLKSPISLQFKVSFLSSFRVALGAGRGRTSGMGMARSSIRGCMGRGSLSPGTWLTFLSGHHSSNFNHVSGNGVQDPGVSSNCCGH